MYNYSSRVDRNYFERRTVWNKPMVNGHKEVVWIKAGMDTPYIGGSPEPFSIKPATPDKVNNVSDQVQVYTNADKRPYVSFNYNFLKKIFEALKPYETRYIDNYSGLFFGYYELEKKEEVYSVMHNKILQKARCVPIHKFVYASKQGGTLVNTKAVYATYYKTDFLKKIMYFQEADVILLVCSSMNSHHYAGIVIFKDDKTQRYISRNVPYNSINLLNRFLNYTSDPEMITKRLNYIKRRYK